MAESSEEANNALKTNDTAEISKESKASTSNDLTGDFDDFCKNFDFRDKESCCYCNGFYGPNGSQPLCVSCHEFVFAKRKRKRKRSSQHGLERTGSKRFHYGFRGFSSFDLEYAGHIAYRNSDYCLHNGTQSPILSTRMRPQLKDLSKFFSEFVQSDSNNDRNERSKNPIQHCSKSTDQPEYKSDKNISDLPEEILLKIFSHLDDIRLFDASKVSTQWKRILSEKEEMWKLYTKKHWPLLQRKTEPTSWFKMYTALESSCCCRICANDMMQKNDTAIVHERLPRLRAELSQMDLLRVSRHRAVALDDKLTRWQASIDGPADSPYKGGTFYLYIDISANYPFEPPNIKFLTKIIHPNISRHGDIGLDIMTWNHYPGLTINQFLISIQSLLCDPFTTVCMEPELGRLYDEDRRRFDALARHWTKKYAMMDEICCEN